MVIKENIFPLVEAMLLLPPEGKYGHIGICTNTSSAGQVISNIEKKFRQHLSVLGSLIVNRDGTERMIINSIAHPTLKYLILFSEESITFAPSTNLLQAIIFGFKKRMAGNYIRNGVATAAHYPNISKKILNIFKEEIIVIPIFMCSKKESKKIILEYLKWLKPKISPDLYKILLAINKKEKIYFDSLNAVLKIIVSLPQKTNKATAKLNPKDFQHLQPPKIIINGSPQKFSTPFQVSKRNKELRLDIRVNNYDYFITGDDPFLIAYSVMKYINKKKKLISPLNQILLGAELGRIKTEISNGIKFDPFILKNKINGKIKIPLESNPKLIVDKKYYYKVNTRESKISVMCLSFNICETVFELLSDSPSALIKKIAEENRFEEYEMDFLHRVDLGIQIGRATIASNLGFAFIQDFDAIFKINKKILPSINAEGDSFLDVHKKVLLNIYTKGITEAHGDPWKGIARSASVLAIFRDTPNSLKKMDNIYSQGLQNPVTIRKNYKRELLRFDHDGTYSYGERTRSYFGLDQLEKTKHLLKIKPDRATIIQRFDPITDMTIYKESGCPTKKFTHDPCLTHDIFFIFNKKLHSFHIARAHNAVNAYPENIFGLYDAYTTEIKKYLKIEGGDMYMLSNRINILLLTEEQKTKKIISEPSKPSDNIETISGPYRIGKNFNLPKIQGAVAYYRGQIKNEKKKPRHLSLKKMESYEKINIIKKALGYLKQRGGIHNNPVMTDYYAKKDNPQDDHLVFLQSNIFGNKIYTTAVFANRSINNIEADKDLLNYISTKFANELQTKLGEMNIYYVAYKL